MTKTGRKMTWATATLALLLIATAILLQGCKADPAASLSKMGIPQTKEGFADAISVGNAKAVDCFLALGTDPNIRLADGMTPLGLAAKGGYLSIVRELLDKAADPNAKLGADEKSALLWAAYGGHGDVVAELLNRGADAKATVTDGNTPLHVAAQTDSAEAVAALIAAGADINAKNKSGVVPLHMAVTHGTGEIVTQLLGAGAKKDIKFFDEDTQANMSALFAAAKVGKAGVIEALLAAGFNPNERLDTWSADTPLMIASSHGNLDAVKALVAGGADVSMVGEEGAGSPFFDAIYGGHADVVRFLIENGTDLTTHVGMDDVRCPLCVAAETGHDQVLQILMDAGLDINHPIRADWEDWETCYWTPLMHAAYNGNKTTVAFLLSKSADPKVKDYSGSTAADLAAEQGYDDIWNMLK